jgi:hypothetical protein
MTIQEYLETVVRTCKEQKMDTYQTLFLDGRRFKELIDYYNGLSRTPSRYLRADDLFEHYFGYMGINFRALDMDKKKKARVTSIYALKPECNGREIRIHVNRDFDFPDGKLIEILDAVEKIINS